MQERLLGIVEERTGYPRDLLDLDQNMEADLGIDSIKRVEIVGALLKSLPDAVKSGLSDATEVLSGQRTLRNMIDWLDARVDPGQAQAEAARPFDLTGAAQDRARTALPRFRIRAQAEPLGAVPSGPSGQPIQLHGHPLPLGCFLVTEDWTGLADHLVQAIEVAGGAARIVPRTALADPQALAALVAEIKASGPVAGLVHLAPVGSPAVDIAAGLAAWRAQTLVNEKGLFYLTRALAADLRAGGRVLAATALGGTFGRIPEDAAATPVAGSALDAQGGAVGLLKSLREEWPQLVVRALDLDPTQPKERQAEQLVAELRLPGGRIEVGYPAGVRTLFRTEPAPLDRTAPPRLTPSADWVVLATGGARGITATAIEALAETGVTLVLAGRSPEPGPEPAALAVLADEAALRTHFIAEARAAGEQPRPVDIGRRVAAVLRERELRDNFRRLREQGARLDYRVADMRDPSQVADLLTGIYERYGRLDGVVHAAGIIEDRLLTDKDPESWERVFDTKVDSAFLLAAHLRPETLRFLVFFTSVAGRYGNSGQTDYAAANELLNRIAWALHRRWQGRVKVAAINWGPWAGSGMVSPEARRKFEALGVELVEPNAGRDLFLDEILRAPPDEVEVVAGLGPWEERESELAVLSAPALQESAPPPEPAAEGATPRSPFPLLGAVARRNGDKGALVLERTIGLTQDPYLAQHSLNAVPVLPAAVALELMAEAAAVLWPGWQVNEVLDLRQLRGITLEGGNLDVDLVAQASTHGDAGGFDAAVEIRPRGAGAPPFYRATVRLAALPLDDAGYPAEPTAGSFSRTAADVYREWLFHGPCFQTMTAITGLDTDGITAEVRPTAPHAWFPEGADPWLFDPGLVDTAPQLAIVWTRVHWGKTALPNRFGRVRRFGGPSLGPCRAYFRVQPNGSGGHGDGGQVAGDQVKADVAFVDQSGALRLLIESMECTASEALNRLGGGWRGDILV